jgi:hypothetical protein
VRDVSAESGQLGGDSLAVYSSTEMVIRCFVPGVNLVSVAGQILFLLRDFGVMFG